jgi:PEGA domain
MEPPSEPDDATPAEWDHLEDELRREVGPGLPAGASPESGQRDGRRSAKTAFAGLLGLRPGSQGSDRAEEGSGDPLSMYPAEHERAGLSSGLQFSRLRRLAWGLAARRYLIWAVGAVAAVLLIAVAVRYLPAGAGPSPSPPDDPGTVVIESRPPAASVSVDGRVRGVTPARLSLPAGTYVFTIQLGEARREITRKVEAGAQIYEYLDLPQPVKTGQLSVATNPPGARVVVDGVDRGVSPVELTGLSVGTHRITLGEGRTSVSQQVTIRAGATSALVVPLASGGQDFGYLSVTSAVPVDVFQDGNLLGSSQSARIMMLAGRHTLDIANDSLGFRTARPVTIAPGAVSKISIELPSGTLSVNAVPWAEVWMDGQRIGETPIANLPARIGPHELVFRHPQFSEQRRSVTVTLKAPARVGVDLRQ